MQCCQAFQLHNSSFRFRLKHWIQTIWIMSEDLRQTSLLYSLYLYYTSRKKQTEYRHLHITVFNVISCTLFLHWLCGILLCQVPVILLMALCSGAGVHTVWGRAGGERFFERSTSWMLPSMPPSAASETLRAAQILASSFSYPEERWVVKTEKLECVERGWSTRGLPVDGLFSERNTAWKLLSKLPFFVSGFPLVAQTSAQSSSCS